MSNLILPKDKEAPFLQANLQAFFERYPHERSRLEPLLSLKCTQIPKLPEAIEVPAAPSKPPIRILLLTGIADPQFLASLLNDKTVQQENFKLFIFENDPEFLRFCFQQSDLTQVIRFQKTEWFLMQDIHSVKPALFRALKPEGVTSMMFNVQVLNVHTPKDEVTERFYNQLPHIYNETAQHILHNHGNLDDSLLGIEVTLRNKDVVLSAPGVMELKNHYDGCAALIVGAGPSLDKNIDTIKKYNDRFVIIAADAALKPLVNAGIRVDYVTSIERLNTYQKPFFENMEPTTAELVAFPVVHPEVLAMYPGPVRLVYRNYSFYAYFNKAYPKGIVRCGGSTSHLGLRLADYFGCKKIFLVGLDSCYEEKDGKYRSHCSGTGHPEWGEFVDLEVLNTKRRHLPPITAVNNVGEKVTSNLTYYQWVKEYAEELAYVGQRANIKNCSAQGLAIDGIPYIPLDKAAESLDPIMVEKPTASGPSIERNWDHKELKQNFHAWLKLAEEAIKEADELLSKDEIDLNRYNVLLYLFNFRFCVDDMFVSFIVQCCALRFFQLENVWWSLSVKGDGDIKEKVQVLKDRFQLFQEVLVRLIKMFEEGEGNNGQQVHQ